MNKVFMTCFQNELSDLKVRGDSITSSEVEVQMRKMAEDGLPEDIAMATGLSPAASDENVDKGWDTASLLCVMLISLPAK